MASAGTAAKAAGAIAAGGGPEDPVGDVVAAGIVAKGDKPKAEPKPAGSQDSPGEQRAQNREARAAESHANRQADRQAKLAPPKRPSTARRSIGWAFSGNRKLLTGEFIACIILLGLGTLLAPEGSKDGMPRAMVKGSALSALFLILALVASGGTGPAKVATGIGTLVTASYVLTSSDVHNVVKWIGAYFSKTGDVTAKNPTGSDTSSAETDEGTVGSDGSYTSANGYAY